MTTLLPAEITDPMACPVGCGRERKPGKVLCELCWFMVPLPLRHDVSRTWTAWEADMRNAHKHRAYRAAVDAAIAAVP